MAEFGLPFEFPETVEEEAESISDKITQAEINKRLSTLRSQSSGYGTSLTSVQNRQEFTKAMINTLHTARARLPPRPPPRPRPRRRRAPARRRPGPPR